MGYDNQILSTWTIGDFDRCLPYLCLVYHFFSYIHSHFITLIPTSFFFLIPINLNHFILFSQYNFSSPNPFSSMLFLFLIYMVYNIPILTLIADKQLKPQPLPSPPPTSHKFIHLILILTLFCFFIHYFFIHLRKEAMD